MKNNYRCCNLVVLIPLLCSFFFLGKTNATPFYHHFTYKPKLFDQQQITGTVRDQQGVTIPGVNVIVSGSSTGTMTNLDGEYTITASVGDTLVYSYIGFKAFKVQVTETFSGDISLQASVDALEEVVINAGYYNTTQWERTGNIVKVSAAEIENQPLTSPLLSLQGRMPGVELSQAGGVSGQAPTIRIRGRNSLRMQGDYPLIILDGVPLDASPINSVGEFGRSSGMDPLSTLNLTNIESIEILKDADATAIYGSRGANGVVLITTKRNTKTKGGTAVQARIYTGVSQISHKMDLMNTREYLSIRRQAFENDGVTPSEANAPDLVLWHQNRDTDWQEVFMGHSSPITDINLSLSESNENTSFLIGGSYHTEGSVFLGDFNYQKATANLNLNHSSNDKKFKLQFTANYGTDQNHLFSGTNFVNYARRLPPNAPAIYTEDGSLNWEGWTISDNPLAVLNQPVEIETNNLIANLQLNYKVLEGLSLRANFGYTDMTSQEVTRNLQESFNPDDWDWIELNSFHSDTKRNSWIVEPQVDFSKDFGQLELNMLGGATFQENTTTNLFLEGIGYSDDHLVGNLNAAEEIRVSTDRKITYRYAALFGRLGINWDKKYFLNLTGRRDGSSRFGPNRRFSEFWAVGGAWIFSEEQFIAEQIPFLSFGKLRASYGTTGSDQIPDYGFLDTYEVTAGPGGLFPTSPFNPNYSWEINRKLEAALQLGFLEDKINLEVAWYRNRSSNQLTGYPLPAMTGFTSVQANLPATIENKGWEFILSITPVQNKKFYWQTSINLTVPENKLVEFENFEMSSYRQTYKIGEPLNIAMLYKFDGIDPETGRYRILDANGDGRYDFEDRIITQPLGRQYYGGIHNNFRFGNFNLEFLVQYIRQDGYSISQITTPPGRYGNTTRDVLRAWQQQGDPEDIQKLSQSVYSLLSYNEAMNSDLVVQDNSFLRLKTLSIGYRFPTGFLDHLGVRELNLFAHVQNLFTLTDYKGLDPETGNNIPPLRTFTAGLQLNL